MKPKVKMIFSSDVYNLEKYSPGDDFCLQLRAIVGLENDECEESVDFEVCTPKWIQNNYGEFQVVSGSDMLIVFEYDLKKIKNKIIEVLESCEGETWQECGQKMSKFGLWEFQSYKE